MSTSPLVLHGVIHGRTIELDQSAGLSDGQHVTVTIEPSPPRPHMLPGGSRQPSAAARAGESERPGDFLDWNAQQLKTI